MISRATLILSLVRKTSSANLATEQVIQQDQPSTININLICQRTANVILG